MPSHCGCRCGSNVNNDSLHICCVSDASLWRCSPGFAEHQKKSRAMPGFGWMCSDNALAAAPARLWSTHHLSLFGKKLLPRTANNGDTRRGWSWPKVLVGVPGAPTIQVKAGVRASVWPDLRSMAFLNRLSSRTESKRCSSNRLRLCKMRSITLSSQASSKAIC
jgi:hypothetical protein